MALQLNLNLKTVLVTSEDEVFKGTQYENAGFIFEISQLTRTQRDVIGRELTETFEDTSNISVNEYNKFLFEKYLISIDGIDLIGDNGAVVTDEELNQQGILRTSATYEVVPQTILDEVMDKINLLSKKAEKKSVKPEIDSPDTQNLQ